MPEYVVRGVPIQFPYDAYPCQQDIFDRVIGSVQDRENAIIESPTGTGKTLCLLTSTLSWLQTYKANRQMFDRMSSKEMEEHLNTNDHSRQLLQATTSVPDKENFVNDRMPKIYYASRTHSQLSQVIQELKCTTYNHVKICVLGSRDQMCLNESVKKLTSSAARTQMCRNYVNNRQCEFHHNVRGARASADSRAIMDIEELVEFGRVKSACPYYMSKEAYADADIVFLPYNYLVDHAARQAQGIKVDNSIIIFDEAHNLESSCGDATSFDITCSDVIAAINEVDMCRDIASRPGYNEQYDVEDYNIIKALLVDFKTKLNALPINGLESSKPGQFAVDFLAEINITSKNVRLLVDMCDSATLILAQEHNKKQSKSALHSWVNAIKTILSYSESSDLLNRSFKVHICEEVGKQQNNNLIWSSATTSARGRTFSFWCFSAGVAMRRIVGEECRSVILASGTLSPLDAFACELQIPFKYRLENPHVIDAQQLFVGVIPKGPAGRILNSSFKNREQDGYRADLGNALVNFARIVPDGLLVFFPSYGLMEQCIESWKNIKSGGKSIWDRLSQFKEPFVEPKDKNDFNKAMDTFYAKIQDPALVGAIFFAVCRGKASEGIDFSGNRARAVIITGIPYPAFKDPKVMLKRQFLDDQYREMQLKGETGLSLLSGDAWYKQQAARAVNQAIGRVIRHRHDWGAILLCDDRFLAQSAKNQLPVWVRPYLKPYASFGEGQGHLTRFFRNRIQLEAVAPPLPVPSPAPERIQNVLRPLDGSSMKPATENGGKRKLELNRKHTTIQCEESSSASYGNMSNPWKAEKKAGNPSSLVSILKEKDPFAAEMKAVPSSAVQSSTSAFNAENLKQISMNATPEAPVPVAVKAKKWASVLGYRAPAATLQPATSSSSISAPAKPNTSEDTKQAAHEYYKQIKSTLTARDYKEFQQSLKHYKDKKCDFYALMHRMEILFDDENLYTLFRPLQHFISPKYHTLFAETADQLELKWVRKRQKLEGIGTTGEEEEEEKDLQDEKVLVKCIICQKRPDMPYKAKCKHIACFQCWAEHLKMQGNKTCAACDLRIHSLRQLKPLYFIFDLPKQHQPTASESETKVDAKQDKSAEAFQEFQK